MEAILDTGALWAMADGSPHILPSLRVIRSVRIPAVVLGEFRCALQYSSKRDEYEGWLTQIATPETVIAADAETARRFAVLRRDLNETGASLPWHDYWIAALALQHGLPVVSQSRHFDEARVQRISW